MRKATYPNLAWNQLESKCSRDIGLIVDAYEHDVRFGGNWKTIQAAESYFNNGSLSVHQCSVNGKYCNI